ncbi:tetratricopeptide repeat protein [Fontivita pretiosa]|uniref:TlpA family protein disulfide reductase n=1 Tax=Fontivita pretiosa TaxID=2989684 RepID=UPI003D175452
MPSRLPKWLRLLVGLGVLLAASGSARAVSHLKPGQQAPAIRLKDLAGVEHSLEQERGRIVVLLFGELYHERTRRACDELHAVLHDPRLADQKISAWLIVAGDIEPRQIEAGPFQRLPRTILHDPLRQAFDAYQVAVMPSLVVLDAQGRVVYAVPGYTSRFSDLLTDALLVAAGKLSPERFADSQRPPATTAESSPQVRADRLAMLARQLARRGLDELAEEKLRQAIEIDPNLLQARLDLGALLLKHRRMAEAETQFRHVLAAQPASVEASIGLAFVQTLRGGTELDEAERIIRDVLARNPTLPRGHYLLGMILEQRGRLDDAAASYKRAAQLLLEQSESQ